MTDRLIGPKPWPDVPVGSADAAALMNVPIVVSERMPVPTRMVPHPLFDEIDRRVRESADFGLAARWDTARAPLWALLDEFRLRATFEVLPDCKEID